MIIRLAISFLILISVSGYSSVSSAQIPADAKAQIALKKAINEAENSQYEAAAASLADYRTHTSGVPPHVELLDAQVHYFKGDFELAYGKLSAYFKAADKSDAGYSAAVELAASLQDFELPFLISQISDDLLAKNPRLAVTQIKEQGYSVGDIQALADAGNLTAMYLTAIIYFQNAEQHEGQPLADQYKQAGEIYFQIACAEGYRRACGYETRKARELTNKLWKNVSSELFEIDISQKRRAKYTHAFRNKAVYYYLNLLVSQNEFSEGYRVCLGHDIFFKQSARLEEGKKRVSQSQPIVAGIDANYGTREVPLKALYQASIRPVTVEKEHSFGVDVSLGSWNPSKLRVQANLGVTDNLVLLNDADATKLRTAIEDFAGLCNIVGPDLKEDFVPLDFVE